MVVCAFARVLGKRRWYYHGGLKDIVILGELTTNVLPQLLQLMLCIIITSDMYTILDIETRVDIALPDCLYMTLFVWWGWGWLGLRYTSA